MISSVFLKYLEEIYTENHVYKPIFITHPLTPRLEKDPKNLMFYQVNPHEIQPHFNVVFEDKIYGIAPGSDNFISAAILFLYIMKNKLYEFSQKLAINGFLNSIITNY